MKKKDNLFIALIFIFLTVFIFRNYFFKGQVPFPANLLVAFYSPWRHYEWEGYPNGPPNKPIGFDDIRLFYPYRKFIIDQFKAGQWPLWNPYNFSGNVHLATYQAPVFYPLNFLYFLLPQIDAWSLLVILQPILSGFFMYLFLKEINLSKKAAFFSAFAFAFSGWMLVWIEEDLVIEHSVLWLPLILYAIEKIGKKISPRNVVLLIFATVSAVLAGFLQLTIYVFAAVLAWLVFRKKLVTLGLCFFLSFFISAVHIGPAIEAYFISPRGIAEAKFLFEEYLMHPGHLITFLAPDFWGNPGAYNYFGSGFYHERMIYFGIPAFLFALFALFSKDKNKTLNFFKWFSLITLGLGFFPSGWLLYFSRLPLLSTMIPSRIFFLSTFGFCTLAAFGLDFCFKNRVNWKLWKNLFFAIGGIFLLLWGFILYHRFTDPHGNYATVALRNLILPTGFFVSSVLVILLPRLKIHRVKFLSLVGMVILSVFSSLYFANKFIYFSERKFVFPEVDVIAKLKEISGVNRIWGYGNAYLEKNVNAYYGLYSPEGYDALFSGRYGELLSSQENEGRVGQEIARCDAELKQASEREDALDNWYRRRLLSLLAVKYIIEAKVGDGKEWNTEQKRFPKQFFQLAWQDEKFKIWEYKNALPRAFLVNDYLVETNKQKIADYLFDKEFDLKKRIILEEEPGLKINGQGDEKQGSVELVQYTANKVALRTNSSVPALLFLSDNYYPGWEASVNGEKTKILRADYSFRAVALPKGEHQVVFSYYPKIFFWSLRVSIFSLILFIGWLIFVKIRENQYQ